MFGYVMPRMEELSHEERARYHAAYCGLCRALAGCFGQRARFSLTYDMTFLALLLGSLYECPEHQGVKRCALHPVKPHPYMCSDAIDYAADMTIALVYHKCLDDWRDGRRVWALGYTKVVHPYYQMVVSRHPHTCAAICRGMADIIEAEKGARTIRKLARKDRNSADLLSAKSSTSRATHEWQSRQEFMNPDAVANIFGALLGEVFAPYNDFWTENLQGFGAKLGKFIYVMDAAVDQKEDEHSGNYNPLLDLNISSQNLFEDLQLLAADATAAFERLPLERDVHLLRSVMYAGMWQKYHLKKEKETKNNKEACRG